MFKSPVTPSDAINKKLIAQLKKDADHRVTRKVQGTAYEYALDSENDQVLIYHEDRLIECKKLDAV